MSYLCLLLNLSLAGADIVTPCTISVRLRDRPGSHRHRFANYGTMISVMVAVAAVVTGTIAIAVVITVMMSTPLGVPRRRVPIPPSLFLSSVPTGRPAVIAVMIVVAVTGHRLMFATIVVPVLAVKSTHRKSARAERE